MSVKVHSFNAAGVPVIQVTGGDDEGAPPPMPAGTRVTRVGGGGDILEETGSPSPEEVAARRAAAAAAPKKIASPRAAAPGKGKPSDRRLCLEAAMASGATGVEEIIEAATRLLIWLEG